MNEVFSIIVKYSDGLLSGLLVTIKMCLQIWGFGIIIGGLFGIISSYFTKSVGRVVRVIAILLAGTPVLVILFWLHYPFQTIVGAVIDPQFTATMTFTLINVFLVSDIVANAIKDLPKQYLLAAKIYNITLARTIFRIQLPLILRQTFPSILIVQVNMIHLTLFGSFIGVEELFRVAQRINAIEYKPIEIYTALGIFFLMISLPLYLMAMYLRNKYTRDLSEK